MYAELTIVAHFDRDELTDKLIKLIGPNRVTGEDSVKGTIFERNFAAIAPRRSRQLYRGRRKLGGIVQGMGMEGSDMSLNQAFGHADHTAVFLSSTEQAVASALYRELSPPFVLADGGDPVAVSTSAGEAFQFTPRFVIKDLERKQSFPLEVAIPPALSLANRLKLKWIDAAYRQLGHDFILLVIDLSTLDERKKRLLEEDGIRAIWASDYTEAAQAISAFLAKRAAHNPAMATHPM